MRISDWSSDVCSSDLLAAPDLVDGGAHIVVNPPARHAAQHAKGVIMGVEQHLVGLQQIGPHDEGATVAEFEVRYLRSEEHTSELQSLMRISYAVFCLKKKKTKTNAKIRDKSN